jgi:hypothetical protein
MRKTLKYSILFTTSSLGKAQVDQATDGCETFA